jgi:hypothetical protein
VQNHENADIVQLQSACTEQEVARWEEKQHALTGQVGWVDDYKADVIQTSLTKYAAGLPQQYDRL